MSYVPAVWLVIFLLRLLFRAVQSRNGGAAASGGGGLFRSAGSSGSELGLANMLLFGLTFVVALPVALLLSTLAGGLPLPGLTPFLLATVTLAASFYGSYALPHWLAWRVLGPWGPRAAGRWVLFLGVYRSVAARAGARELYRSRFEEGWESRGLPVNLWTIAAEALRAERLGDQDLSAALLGLFAPRPFRVRSWRRPAAVAAEVLAWNALRSGDGKRAASCVAAGAGRGLWLPRLLAALQLGEPVPAYRLALAWLCSPYRVRSFPDLKAALGRASGRGERLVATALARARTVPLPNPHTVGPERAHLAFLAHAATGGALRTGDLERLAESWSRRFAGEAANAGLLRRALELGAQEVPALPGELRAALVAELEALAERVEGEWTAAEGTLASTLRQKALGHAYEAVEREIRDFEAAENAVAESRLMASGLEELERWLRLCKSVSQVLRRGGPAALQTLWFGGLRYTACNWGVFLVRQRGDDATWAAFLMHSWSAELASRVGDEEIRALSQDNAKLTRARLG